MFTYSILIIYCRLNPTKYAVFVSLSPACIEFRENVEIPRKRANSAARLKIPLSAENCVPGICLLYVCELYVIHVLSVGVAYSGQQVEQIDMAATLAVLFAVPIPVNSLGVLIHEALSGLSIGDQLKAAYINAMQIQRVAHTGLTDHAQS